jgi:prepilin-type N-terminal cleavage/methylation domain-containing protein
VSDARGFTLIEMVIAVSILGIIATSIGVVGVVMFRTLGETQSRLNETRGPRFASVYWIPDVASTETVNPTAAPTACGATGLVTLQWTDDRPTLGKVTVTYAITTSGTQTQLVRRLCTNGSATATRTTTIAPSIASAQITCGDGTSYGGCQPLDSDKSLLLKITPKSGGGTFSVDAYREVS